MTVKSGSLTRTSGVFRSRIRVSLAVCLTLIRMNRWVARRTRSHLSGQFGFSFRMIVRVSGAATAYNHRVFESLAAAAAFGLSGGLSPGPLLALVVGETLARGRRAGLAVAAAPLLTDGPIIAAAIFLLGRIENSEPALGIVSLAGGAVLASFGIAGFRGNDPEIKEDAAALRVWGSLGKGVAVNLFNPSPYLFWLTVGTPLLLRANDSSRWTAVAFLVVFYLGLVGSKALLAVLVARSRNVLRGRGYLWANRILSAVLLVYAGIFIREGIVRLAGS
jgi:threonine/homoserine/homoserine lactone efflux protein